MKNIEDTSAKTRTISVVVAAVMLIMVWFRQQKGSQNITQSPKSNNGLEAILEKCNEGNVKSVLAMLEEDPYLLNATDDSGWSCLINASKNNHLELVQNLLAKGASTGTRAMKHSALRGAAIFGHNRVVTELLKAGAFVDVYSTHQRTPLMGAAMNGHIEVVRLLLQAGADKTLKNDEGETAGDLAQANGHMNIVELLT